MLKLDQPQIQQNVNTELQITSDHGTWNPAPTTTQPTTFSITGTGGSIVSEYIVDRYTAILTVAGTSGSQILTLTDTVNNEAVSVSVQSMTLLDSEITSDGDTLSSDL